MSLLWLRPAQAEAGFSPDERRIRDFVAARAGISESVLSLAAKLEVSRRTCRRVLEQLAHDGVLRRRDFDDIEPLYYRYPGR